jgi:hypothetical protein
MDYDTSADVTAGAALGTSSSTETAQPLTGTKAATLGTATETGTPQTFASSKTAALAPAAEQGAAQPLAGTKKTTLTPATEADAANRPSRSPGPRPPRSRRLPRPTQPNPSLA